MERNNQRPLHLLTLNTVNTVDLSREFTLLHTSNPEPAKLTIYSLMLSFQGAHFRPQTTIFNAFGPSPSACFSFFQILHTKQCLISVCASAYASYHPYTLPLILNNRYVQATKEIREIVTF